MAKKKIPGLSWTSALILKSAKLAKAVKLLKFTKVLLTFGSMTVSILAYSFRMGLWFAVGFVLLIFAHEMGHVIANKKLGFPASAPV